MISLIRSDVDELGFKLATPDCAIRCATDWAMEAG